MAEKLTKADFARLKSRIANMREKAKDAARLTSHSAITIAGGAVAGVIEEKYPLLGDTEVPTVGALDALLVAASVTGILDDQSDNMAALGSGMLAAVAARETQKMLAASAAASGG